MSIKYKNLSIEQGISEFASLHETNESLLGAIRETHQDRLLRAIDAGGLLLHLKSQVKHGEWEKWRLENITEPFDITKSTLQEYQELFEYKDYIFELMQKPERSGFCFSKSWALKEIRKLRAQKDSDRRNKELAEQVQQQQQDKLEKQQDIESRNESELKQRPVLGIGAEQISSAGETEKRLLIADIVLAMLEDKEFSFPDDDPLDRPTFDPKFYTLLKKLGEGIRARQRSGRPELKIVSSKEDVA